MSGPLCAVSNTIAYLKTKNIQKADMSYNDGGQEMIHMAKRYESSDSEWEQIENLLPTPKTGCPLK